MEMFLAGLGDIPGRLPETVADLPERDAWLGRNLRRATNAILHNFAEHFADFQIRPALFSALYFIERHPGSSGAELSDMMQVPRANMVLILRELEKRGLIVRKQSQANKRAQALFLSQAGEDLMPQLHQAHLEHTREVYGLMSEAERDFLMHILRRLWATAPDATEAD